MINKCFFENITFMEKRDINRVQLERFSYNELKDIADEYGIDVPESFNRNFLIGEILKCAEEAENEDDSSEMIFVDEALYPKKTDDVPIRSYDSTEVEIILRNPAWAYIYWNISDADRHSLDDAFISDMHIRVNSFSEREQGKPDEFFDISISKKDTGQYVLLPQGRKFFRVDLLFNIDGIIDILDSSAVIEMPMGTSLLVESHPGKDDNLSEIMKLSGMEELLLQQYKNHRESFS